MVCLQVGMMKMNVAVVMVEAYAPSLALPKSMDLSTWQFMIFFAEGGRARAQTYKLGVSGQVFRGLVWWSKIISVLEGRSISEGSHTPDDPRGKRTRGT